MNPKDAVGLTKPNLSIVPLAPLYEVSVALVEGARKYGPNNWRSQSVSETIYVDAAIRHLTQWLSGESNDQDSGLSHITKAIAGLLILRDAQIHNCSIDDRGPQQNLNIPALMEKLSALVVKYPGIVLGTVTEEVTEDEDEDEDDAITGFVPADAIAIVATIAGGGNYVLSTNDVGRRVLLRSGHYKTIIQEPGIGFWPIRYADSSDGPVVSNAQLAMSNTCTPSGQCSADLKSTNYLEGKNFLSDVVAIIDPDPSTVAGGGSYVLSADDVGSSVVMRNGEILTIVKFDNSVTAGRYPIKCVGTDGRARSLTVDGFFAWWSSPKSQHNEDIVQVHRRALAPTQAPTQAPSHAKWADVVAGGGDYVLSEEDVNRTVRLRNGSTSSILGMTCHPSVWAVRYRGTSNDTFSCTINGQYSCERDSEEYNRAHDSGEDIVEVLVSNPATGTPEKWLNVISVGGRHVLSADDTERTVRLRNGETGRILGMVDRESIWRVKYISADRTYRTCTVYGQYSAELSSENYDESKDDPYDIVSVLDAPIVAPEKWSYVVAGGGDYVLSPEDKTRTVRLRSGQTGIITGFSSGQVIWKVAFRGRDNASCSCTVHGQYSSNLNAENYDESYNDERDIVAVLL